MNLFNPQPDAIPFEFGDLVWMKIDTTGEAIGAGQVIGVLFKPGATMLQVQWGIGRIDYHYFFELTKEAPSEFNNAE
jgi:hypothetical protein